MIVNKIKKIVDALLSPSDQHLQGMQNIRTDEANLEFEQAQCFEQLAIEHHLTCDNDQSSYNNRNAIWNFLSAALKGHSDAQYKLGVAYLHGQSGLDKNYTLAEEWLKEAAKQGHHEAQMTLEKAYSQLAFS